MRERKCDKWKSRKRKNWREKKWDEREKIMRNTRKERKSDERDWKERVCDERECAYLFIFFKVFSFFFWNFGRNLAAFYFYKFLINVNNILWIALNTNFAHN